MGWVVGSGDCSIGGPLAPSHAHGPRCSDAELSTIRQSVSELIVRMRVGTRLWLGDRSTLSASGTVLAVHPLSEGVKVGYRQRKSGKNATLVVVSGGTANGIGLSAPSPTTSLRQRAKLPAVKRGRKIDVSV